MKTHHISTRSTGYQRKLTPLKKTHPSHERPHVAIHQVGALSAEMIICLAAIIVPGQNGTYRHLRSRVTGSLAESGQMRCPGVLRCCTLSGKSTRLKSCLQAEGPRRTVIMAIPGFTAEDSLHLALHRYGARIRSQRPSQELVPQQDCLYDCESHYSHCLRRGGRFLCGAVAMMCVIGCF